MELQPQAPAEGISAVRTYGDFKWYKVPCDCGCDKEISFSVEIDDCAITANISSITKTKYWYQRWHIDGDEPWLLYVGKQFFNDWYNRLEVVWNVLVHGYIETSSDVILSRQQCLNFSELLKTSIADFDVIVAAEKATREANKKSKENV